MQLATETREIRVLNRNFSLGEYGEPWTKIERYLFIEIYNVIKEFYIAKNADNIVHFSSESITLSLPITSINKRLIKKTNRARQICEAAEALSKKQINIKTQDAKGQIGFDFISIFPRITYNPEKDRNNMFVKIPSEIYEEMVPIQSYCQLDLKLISEFGSGNTIRLYEIFKSYAFKKKFSVTFEELRKKLGFYREEKYKEWKHFNNQVLKPAVKDINDHKEYDIEVNYSKQRGLQAIEFTVIVHASQSKTSTNILSLDEKIDGNTREPNMIQNKYVDTLIERCNQVVPFSNPEELKQWIVSDLISQQNKQGNQFNFRYAMNAISKQLREGTYRKPFAHKRLTAV